VIVTIVGDAFLDRDMEGRVDRVCPDAPVPVLEVATERARPGGAALAAVLAARAAPPGTCVRLVAAFSDDAAAGELRALVEEAGVEVAALAREGPTIEKVRVRAAGQSLVRVDRGHRGARVEAGAGTAALIGAADALLVADYGAGVLPAVRRWVADAPRRRPVVWDPYPDGVPPVPGSWLVTPNEHEARAAAGLRDGPRLKVAAEAGCMLARSWGVRGVAAVDAVAVFDEDTPVGLLDALRPHVFVKGGDYALGELPEADAMASWGGHVVILPYLRGRSTTALLERATRG